MVFKAFRQADMHTKLTRHHQVCGNRLKDLSDCKHSRAEASITQSAYPIANDIKLGSYNRLGKISLINRWTYVKSCSFVRHKIRLLLW